MSGDIEKDKTKADLENLGQLVDRYAQSRSLQLLISLPILVINVALLIGATKLVLAYGLQIGQRWSLVIMGLVFLWIVFSSTWLVAKLLDRYGICFYKKEGNVELQQENAPIWAWVAFVVTFVGPVFLNMFWIMPVRCGLVISLTSFGIFMLYVCKKQKDVALGVVYGTLSLIGATAAAIGVPVPLAEERSYFLPLIIYIIVAGLITVIVVHIYNRKILHKLKEMRPFSEQETSKPDS